MNESSVIVGIDANWVIGLLLTAILSLSGAIVYLYKQNAKTIHRLSNALVETQRVIEAFSKTLNEGITAVKGAMDVHCAVSNKDFESIKDILKGRSK